MDAAFREFAINLVFIAIVVIAVVGLREYLSVRSRTARRRGPFDRK